MHASSSQDCNRYCSSHQDIFKSNIEVVTKIDRMSEDVGDMKDLMERVMNRVTALETELAVWKRFSERRLWGVGTVVALLAVITQLAPWFVRS